MEWLPMMLKYIDWFILAVFNMKYVKKFGHICLDITGKSIQIFYVSLRENFTFPFFANSFGSTEDERAQLDESTRHYYETTMSEWLAVEAIVRQRDKEKTAHAVAKLSSESGSDHKNKGVDIDVADGDNDVFEENEFSDLSDPEDYDEETADKTLSPAKHCNGSAGVAPQKPNRLNKISTDSGNVADEDLTKVDDATPVAECSNIEMKLNISENCFAELSPSSAAGISSSNKSSPSTSSYETVANDFTDLIEPIVKADHFDGVDVMSEQLSPGNSRHAVIITDASIDIVNIPFDDDDTTTAADSSNAESKLETLHEEITVNTVLDALQEPKSACVSPASSNGGIYSVS